jgi:hypothetical protein
MKPKARRFLTGLSADELQFIAEFLGSCILECSEASANSRAQLAERIARYGRGSADCSRRAEDHDHKSILLLEYLCRSGLQRQTSAAAMRIN